MNDVLRKQEDDAELVQEMIRAYGELGGMKASLAVARQAHAGEAIELMEIMRYEKALSIADFTSEFKARFLAQQETKTPEERLMIEPLEITYRPFDGSLRAGVCGRCGAWVCDQLAHTGWHNSGRLRAKLAGKEPK